MSKHLSPDVFFDLPSGNRVHPWRLIHRDGTIMWKHALWHPNGFTYVPHEQAHEAHIIKTAQRLEELNCWASQGLEPWEFLQPTNWYCIDHEQEPFQKGYACIFKHTSIENDLILKTLAPHIQEHEELKECEQGLYFKRC